MAQHSRQQQHALRPMVAIMAAWFLWSLLVFYPNPADLARSLYRLAVPPVDAARVSDWAATLPDDPKAIEAAVLETHPYHHDWLAHERPWYYPTTAEALAADGGDCKTQYILMASLFEAKGMPYQTRISLTHIWVDWEGRTPRGSAEQAQAAVWHRDADGRLRWQLPDWATATPSFSLLRHAWWELMPPLRRHLFAGGSVAALAALLAVALHRRLPAISGADPAARRVRDLHPSSHGPAPPP